MKLKRKLFAYSSVGCMLMILLISCSRKTEYTSVIPADVSMLVSMDMKSIWEKSGLDNKKARTREKIMEILKGQVNEHTFSYLEKIAEDPSESGIKWNNPIYFFSAGQVAGVVADVSKKNKLEDSFKVWAEEKLCSPLEKSDNYLYTVWEGQVVCAFNEKVLLAVTSTSLFNLEELKERISRLMRQEEKNSIYSNKAFLKLKEQTGDVKLMARGENLSFFPLPVVNMMASYSEVLKGITALATVNFEKGKISVRCEPYFDNKEQAEYYEKINFLRKGKGQFLDYLPATSLMFFNMNLNGEKMYDYLAGNKETADAVNSARQMDIDIQKLLSSFDGDLSVALTSFSMEKSAFMAYAEMKNDYFINALTTQKELMQMLLGGEVEQKGKNAYQLSFRGLELYFGMIGKHFYFTNDASVLSSIDDKISSSMANAPWAKTVKEASSCFVINIEACLQSPLFRSFMNTGNPQDKIFANILSACSYMQMYSLADKNRLEMDIVLKQQKENALKQIVAGFENIYAISK